MLKDIISTIKVGLILTLLATLAGSITINTLGDTLV